MSTSIYTFENKFLEVQLRGLRLCVFLGILKHIIKNPLEIPTHTPTSHVSGVHTLSWVLIIFEELFGRWKVVSYFHMLFHFFTFYGLCLYVFPLGMFHHLFLIFKHSWLLNNVGLNCAGPLIQEFFFYSKYYSIHNLQLVESEDVELGLWKNHI